ncbi:MAG: histidine kinase [Prolixibacteraceae bacterium]|nr:histidine kinase [Prolixibacteraceae bacterium]
MKQEKIFNDKWIGIIGIPFVGFAFPFLFGMRPGNPMFWGWILISTGITFFSWIGTRQFGILLWNKFPWEKKPFLHIITVIAYIVFFTAAFIIVVYFINRIIKGETENYWQNNKTLNLAILLVFVFIVIIHELAYLFFSWKKEITRSANLEKEHMQAKFEALKNQVNPHFLFNSLGTLSSLINSDQNKAVQYVNEFSKIYRYILDVNNTDFVNLSEETDFINSYIFLQHIRYGEGFRFENHINKSLHSSYILPLTLQLLIENALKHNTLSVKSPLIIEAFSNEQEELIIVRNNRQLRNVENSPGLGLKNLEQRYRNFTGKSIKHYFSEEHFVVEIPIIKGEE